MLPAGYHSEAFTPAEEQVLSRFFTNTDLPVFALKNLPQVVAGALFARYSRTSKSLRRLFLDEFVADPERGIEAIASHSGAGVVDLGAAERLYERVFLGFGDDSVAQLGAAHVACEQVSNVVTKVIEWGRLASYLEQSTRYIRYDDLVGGRYRYHVPAEVVAAGWDGRFSSVVDSVFGTYSELVSDLVDYFAAQPRPDGLTDVTWRGLVRSRACDAARGLLPAATRSNLGVFASGQAFEHMLVRLQASPLHEARLYGKLMLTELRKVIPSFLTRVDRPDRGQAHSEYLRAIRRDVALVTAELALGADLPSGPTEEVRLVAWDPDGERRITEALLFEGGLSGAAARCLADRLSSVEVDRLWAAAVGERTNRRHRPGRAFEETAYRFEICSDYGAFRDLQRHRMMSISWQPLGCLDGFEVPEVVVELGWEGRYTEAMAAAGQLWAELVPLVGEEASAYAVPLGYRLRYAMTFNARQAFHMLELRSQPNGHPSYRRVAAEMARQIGDIAGHRRVARAMSFVDYSDGADGRLEESRRNSR